MFINVSLSILLKLISLESVGIAFRSGENHNYSAFFLGEKNNLIWAIRDYVLLMVEFIL
jgi:hypothetical protein